MYENNERLAMGEGLEQKAPDNLAQRRQSVSVRMLKLEGEAGPEDVYENSLESRFEDRNNTEMSRFTFSPEDSRSYYDTTANRTWHDLALLPKGANAVLREDKIYLSKQNAKIVCTIMKAQGSVTVLTNLDAPICFAMDHLIPLKQDILALTTLAGHTSVFPNITHYYGIDCVNDTLATPAREEETFSSGCQVFRADVAEGQVGLIYRNGVPEFIGPGKHILFEPDERFVRYEQVSSRLITHGSIKVIRVRDEELVCIKDAYKGGDFRLLSTGTHIIKSPTAKLYPVINAYNQEMVIRTSLEGVMPDPLDVRQRPTPSPAGPAPASKDKGKEEKKPSIKATADERIIFEKISKGKQGVAYDDKGNIQQGKIV